MESQFMKYFCWKYVDNFRRESKWFTLSKQVSLVILSAEIMTDGFHSQVVLIFIALICLMWKIINYNCILAVQSTPVLLTMKVKLDCWNVLLVLFSIIISYYTENPSSSAYLLASLNIKCYIWNFPFKRPQKFLTMELKCKDNKNGLHLMLKCAWYKLIGTSEVWIFTYTIDMLANPN